jgi:hypothetical protein
MECAGAEKAAKWFGEYLLGLMNGHRTKRRKREFQVVGMVVAQIER